MLAWMSWSQQTAGADTWLCWRWLLTSFRSISKVHKSVFDSALHSSAADQRFQVTHVEILPSPAWFTDVWPGMHRLLLPGNVCVHGQCRDLALPPAIFQKPGALRAHSVPNLGLSQRSGQRRMSRAPREGCTAPWCTCSVVTHARAVLKAHHYLYIYLITELTFKKT